MCQKNFLLSQQKYSVEIDCLSFQQNHSLNIFLNGNVSNILVLQHKYFVICNLTVNKTKLQRFDRSSLVTYKLHIKFLIFPCVTPEHSVKRKYQNFWNNSTNQSTLPPYPSPAWRSAQRSHNILSYILNSKRTYIGMFLAS